MAKKTKTISAAPALDKATELAKQREFYIGQGARRREEAADYIEEAATYIKDQMDRLLGDCKAARTDQRVDAALLNQAYHAIAWAVANAQSDLSNASRSLADAARAALMTVGTDLELAKVPAGPAYHTTFDRDGKPISVTIPEDE